MNNKRQNTATIPLIALVLVAFASLAGCGSHSPSYYNSIKRTVVDAKDDFLGTRPTTAELFKEDDTPLIDINNDAADDMMGFLSPVNKESPIYVSRFTNRANGGDGSPFGLLVADQVAARLASHGFMITAGPARIPAADGRPPRAKPVSPMLSGEERKAAEKRSYESLHAPRPCRLTGTYLVADKVVYVDARITALDDNQVLAAQAWTVPINRNTRALLFPGRHPGGMTPRVRTKFLGRSPHKIGNPFGQPQNDVTRNLVL